MSIIGSLIAIGAGLANAALGILFLWGISFTLRQEVRRGFVSRPASNTSGQWLTILGLVLPLGITAVFALFAALRMLQVAFGLG